MRFFSRVQIGSGAHPATYPMVIEDSPSGVKRPEREAEYSLPSSVRLRMRGAIPLLPYMSSQHGT